MTDLLLAYDFPPIGGGIARWMAELALRYPGGGLVVSTGSLPNADDRRFPNPIDRIAVPSGRLKTLQGLWVWRGRVRELIARHSVQFVWCGNLRPAGYVAARTRQRADSSFRRSRMASNLPNEGLPRAAKRVGSSGSCQVN